MPLLDVKIFDNNNTEINSTVSVTSDQTFYDLVPAINDLADKTPKNEVQALIINHQLIAYYKIFPEKLLFIATATVNTSFRKLEQFLTILGDSFQTPDTYNSLNSSANFFHDHCVTLVKTVDSPNRTLSIALLGLARSGKTTFANFFEKDQALTVFETYQPTNLLNIVKMEHISGLPSIRFLDLGWNFKQDWWKFRKESDGYIFFVDTSNSLHMKKALDLLQEIRSFWDLPFVVAANMRDTSKIKNIRKYLARKFRLPIRQIYLIETFTDNGLLPLLNGLIGREVRGEEISISLVKSNNK
ncbi:MAG: ADP-ribosylation factor-like protein [Candidatus Hodarchaeales archaeon]|jgi:hypothetical protein